MKAPDRFQDDHLAPLFFGGDAASVGAYTPERVTLRLSGLDAAVDHIVYLHEIHHAGLNDSTAWGVALHAFAALGAPHDACRLPHEAYATFASVNIAAARHDSALSTPARYPTYQPLYAAFARLTVRAGGPHRRYLLATALARLTMQTPILGVLPGARA